MKQEHKLRVLAGIGGLILLFGIYFLFGHYGLVGLTVLVSAAAYYEFLGFSNSAADSRIPSVLAGAALSAWLCLGLPGAVVALYVAMLVILLRTLWRVHRSNGDPLRDEFFRGQARVFGLLYMVVLPSFLPKVHALPHGPFFLLFLLCIVWVGDTAAYYGGKNLGRTKLSVNVSPGKTLEGSLTGLLACAALGFVFCRYGLAHLPWWKLVAIAAASSVIAMAGDLLESLMKRAYSVKDSGGLIPGHGGVFDRFDSLILVTPFFYLLLRALT